MNAARKIRKYLTRQGENDSLRVLLELAHALDGKQHFALERLYELDSEYFELGLELMRDWRLDRHRLARGKLVSLLSPTASEADERDAGA
ncbi:hypothetical protein ABWL39_08840 [Chitinivorax sp. PXF-14]|uniref:hypothetical protein n=1 Tax=Chitinivorax sp. PXF-14 TaxID=3230488 RepID=UPI0034669C31